MPAHVKITLTLREAQAVHLALFNYTEGTDPMDRSEAELLKAMQRVDAKLRRELVAKAQRKLKISSERTPPERLHADAALGRSPGTTARLEREARASDPDRYATGVPDTAHEANERHEGQT